ncbi:hypothetical protein BN1050_00024 [Metalysinibacillus saudimassiliensis]|uniref:DUF2232 domain-containing protein n=1 Tax=Metalysinibacillus saudimassiliensis TaxID=1461583 RepID=A0A078LZ04_9BACL|nr:hypothetical protein BN1050_00024 [Metalysinibacillus saudimassiliensis]
MPSTKNQSLVYGAVMTALFVILLFMTAFIPVVSFFTAFITPLPLMWYGAKFDRKQTLLVGVVAILLGSLLGGIVIVPAALSFAVIGVVVGIAIQSNYSKIGLLMTTGLTVLAITVVMYVALMQFLAIDVITEMLATTRESYLKMNEAFLTTSGKEAMSEADIDKLIMMLEALIPALLTLSSFLMAFIMLSVSLPILQRLGIKVPKFSPFKDMRLPRAVLWYYLVVVTVKLFANPEVGSTLYTVTYNFDVILSVLLVLQAFSLIQYYLASRGMSSVVGIIICVLLLPLFPLLVLVGVLDLGMDIRTFITNKIKK